MATRRKAARGRLSVFGLGPRGLPQLTLELVDLLKSCGEVVSMTSFEKPLAAFCEGLGVPLRALDWGQDAARRSPAAAPGGFPREKVLDAVLEALARGAHVGLAVDGHPAVFSFAAEIKRRAADAGHEARLYPSLQPLDQILAVLEERGETLDAGVALLSALSPSIAEAEVPASCGLLLYNLGHLRRGDAAAFERLRRALAQARGPGQRVLLVECTPDQDNVRAGTLASLAGDLDLIGVNATAFVPARASR